MKRKGSPPSRIRIIGGTHRGRKIPVLELDGLRPTGDRLRETLFNWLAPSLQGAKILDAFAGSGALSFEALSRGAETALLLDNSSLASDQLKSSAAQLDVKAEVRCQDALQFFGAEQANPQYSFDIIFLDPPFKGDLLQKCVDSLAKSSLLSPGGLIYLEQPSSHSTITTPVNWFLRREKTLGDVSCCLYQLDLDRN